MDTIFGIIRQGNAETHKNHGVIPEGLKYVLILTQLVVLSWLINRYELEESLGLPDFIPYVAAAIVLHSLLPLKWRLTFFILAGIGGIFWMLNWIPGLVVLGLFAVFFSILQLPISVTARATGIVLAAAGLAFTWIKIPTQIPDSLQVVPIVGSIFMFRASVYLYDIRHEKIPAPFLQQLAYFLMLPNLVFTLFPVVDYKIFNRTYYDQPTLEIYQKGVRWMIRGFFHLMLYRIIYYYVQPPLEEVDGLLSIVFYAVTSYLLILRLSGLFHTAIGILCLFGFNLPPVFHNYFLASGFSDLWRRINVYWRDYIMKIFYYPIYFRLRNLGKKLRMVISILLAFGITWMLHSYQWFWLQGNFPLRKIDAIFWGIFGITVTVSSLYQQAKFKKKRSGSNYLIRAAQVLGMFLFMSILWTFWNSPSIESWLIFMKPVANTNLLEWGQLLGALIATLFMVGLGFYLFEKPKVKAFLEPDDGKNLSVFWGGLTLVLFILVSIPAFLNLFQPLTDKPIVHLYESRLNKDDASALLQGYYEDILVPNQFSALAEVKKEVPENPQNIRREQAWVPTKSWLTGRFLPNQDITFKDRKLTTNEWAMRDKSYPEIKESGHFRIAILGGSYSMGSGVHDHEVFEVICEDSLNKGNLYNVQFELMNFSTPAHHIMQHVYRLEHEVLKFKPDAVMIISQGMEYEKSASTLRENLYRERPIQLSFIPAIIDRFNLEYGEHITIHKDSLKLLNYALGDSSLVRIANLCKTNNIQPIFVYWPQTRSAMNPTELERLLEKSRQEGFINLDYRDVYDGYELEELILARKDRHPNDVGHLLVAYRLYNSLTSNPEIQKMIQSAHPDLKPN